MQIRCAREFWLPRVQRTVAAQGVTDSRHVSTRQQQRRSVYRRVSAPASPGTVCCTWAFNSLLPITATWRSRTPPCAPAALRPLRPQAAPAVAGPASCHTRSTRSPCHLQKFIVSNKQVNSNSSSHPNVPAHVASFTFEDGHEHQTDAAALCGGDSVAHPGRGRLTVTCAAAAAARLSGAASGSGRFQHRMEPP